ncbi:hypothetical protein [Gloeocapsopsis sp. IPPAS B-1203]|uniref:hypothetical protein n=1 Tax=Gloeocapsopsis sp. IPPAS B-1203 TaxID=2049454 RepID=UPI000C187B61|nr:hypothetical protein [Gloeocapsopsis sp. IPPAS B-1203]PIG90986.1 hypothetical protein CSQ79_23420 [Gloeocapsopsis sp. IPPAS B-1203]
MHQKIVCLFTFFSLYLPINVPKVIAQEVSQQETTYQISQRPDTDNPTEVAVGVYLIDFDTFDEIDESFKLNGYLFLTWQDQRLAFNPSQTAVNSKTYNIGEIWTPNIKFLNIESVRETAYILLKVEPDGTVHYKERFTGQFNSEMNLQRFPFDRQKLRVIVEALDNIENIVLLADNSKTGAAKDAFLTGWRIRDFQAFPRVRVSEVEEESFSEYVSEINILRYHNPYIWNVFLPLLFIIIVSWTVFWSRSFESNTVIATSSLVSAIAFNIVVVEELPKVSYLTFINGFILIVYVFICLVIIYTVVKHWLDLEKKKELSLKIDRTARWLVPAVFGVSNIILIAASLL